MDDTFLFEAIINLFSFKNKFICYVLQRNVQIWLKRIAIHIDGGIGLILHFDYGIVGK